MSSWSLLDFLQYKRIAKKTWEMTTGRSQKIFTVFPIREKVKKQLMEEGYMILLKETNGIVYYYNMW